jgi:acetyltransferase-like isoleucine patch superfamily enzyme
MMQKAIEPRDARRGSAWRVGCTIVSIFVVESLICAVAAVPPVLLWSWLLGLWPDRLVGRSLVFSLAAIPSYLLFALGLMVVSPLVCRATGARTPLNADFRLADMSWPVMRWARYMVAIHVVRVFAGTLFRSSPIWTAYLRLDGARIGRRVYVNTLFTSDHNLLEFGDDVVIGADVHLSAHTVEAGRLKTAPVRLGAGVVIGLDSVIDIGVECGPGAQVAAMSFVPKYAKLEAGALYAGIPVRLIHHGHAHHEELRI